MFVGHTGGRQARQLNLAELLARLLGGMYGRGELVRRRETDTGQLSPALCGRSEWLVGWELGQDVGGLAQGAGSQLGPGRQGCARPCAGCREPALARGAGASSGQVDKQAESLAETRDEG